MTPDEAERVVALAEELDTAVSLAAEADGARPAWVRLAAERVVERIHQAAAALDRGQAERYLTVDGLRALRGMRNRLAHNYLAIDETVLWRALSDEAPAARARLEDDLRVAHAVLAGSRRAAQDAETWRSGHLRPLDPS
ncbi:HepT-like ribonuclease domain-containing protein [Cellulomonas sp. IC4_254]|uniref:HepT-like ribonuclease domain-containing protein n=1 Tax=Cellulomonas sp. IC4_254 TaxID=2714040 RepID=UPI001421EE69|nr:DUF86 domain-containing protein [Cellulomonas sp. IC4_254]